MPGRCLPPLVGQGLPETPQHREDNPTDPAQNNEHHKGTLTIHGRPFTTGAMQPDPTACAGVPKGRRVLLFSSTGPLSRLKDLLGKAKEVAGLVEDASG